MVSEMATKPSAGSPDTVVGDDNEYRRIMRLRALGVRRRMVRHMLMVWRLKRGHRA